MFLCVRGIDIKVSGHVLCVRGIDHVYFVLGVSILK